MTSTRPWLLALFSTWPGRSTVFIRQLCPKVSPPEKEALQKALDPFNSFNEVTGIFKVDAGGKILLEDAAKEESGLAEGLLNLDYRGTGRKPAKRKDWATADRIRTASKNWA